MPYYDYKDIKVSDTEQVGPETDSETVPEFLIIKPEKGGIAFWRLLAHSLKFGKHKVIRLRLHSKAFLYIFPKEAFKHLPSLVSKMEVKGLNIIRWDREVIEVEKQKVRFKMWLYESESWKLIVRTKERTYEVWPSQTIRKYVEETGTDSDTGLAAHTESDTEDLRSTESETGDLLEADEEL